MRYEVKIKPLSVNEAWQGRRFKTRAHRGYRRQLSLGLPEGVFIPEGDLRVEYTFKVSNRRSDYDNLIKAFQDALCDQYGFDDSRICQATIRKKVVSRGDEGVEFEIGAISLS